MSVSKTAKKTRTSVGDSTRWLELAAEFPLRPIRSDEDLERAIAMIDRVTDIESPTSSEADYRDVLADLIADYEDEHEPDDVSPAEMLRHLIDSRGVTQAEVARGSGLSDATISHILVGHRPPSRRAITALSAYFKVDPAVFL
jgi:HTH-type transcriptional regulator/antitoxin HigA